MTCYYTTNSLHDFTKINQIVKKNDYMTIG